MKTELKWFNNGLSSNILYNTSWTVGFYYESGLVTLV